MRTISDSEYNSLTGALLKVSLQIQSNQFERRPGGWIYKVRTFCFPASTQVKIRLGDNLIEVMGISNESPDEAVLDLIEKFSKGIVEVSSANGRDVTRYCFKREGKEGNEEYKFSRINFVSTV